MITKEKIIFLALLPALIAILVIGIKTQETKKKSTGEFLKDIESVTEKAKAKKKAAGDSWDIDGLKKQETIEDYPLLAERDIFSRPVSEMKEEIKRDIVPLKEEPKRPLFVYKGKMTLGARVIVIIEDQNTGKSFSVKEGDSAGEFVVVAIGDKEILLRKNSGEEIVIPTAKEEKEETKAEGAEGLDEKK